MRVLASPGYDKRFPRVSFIIHSQLLGKYTMAKINLNMIFFLLVNIIILEGNSFRLTTLYTSRARINFPSSSEIHLMPCATVSIYCQFLCVIIVVRKCALNNIKFMCVYILYNISYICLQGSWQPTRLRFYTKDRISCARDENKTACEGFSHKFWVQFSDFLWGGVKGIK